MTPLIKTALSLLAASATGVSGGLLYDNKDEILKFFGWSGEEVSDEPSSSDSVTPPTVIDQVALQGSKENGVPAPATEIQGTNLSPLGGGASKESQNLEVANPVADLGDNLNSEASQNLRNQDDQIPRLPATSVPPAPTLKGFQCAFEEKNYESEPNKKALKELLKEKGKVGLQIIIDETNKTYKCAKSLGEEETGKLLDYLKTRDEINQQAGQENKDALPIAVKQKADKSWTIFEGDNEDGETLEPIQDNSQSE